MGYQYSLLVLIKFLSVLDELKISSTLHQWLWTTTSYSFPFNTFCNANAESFPPLQLNIAFFLLFILHHLRSFLKLTHNGRAYAHWRFAWSFRCKPENAPVGYKTTNWASTRYFLWAGVRRSPFCFSIVFIV